MKRFLSGLLTAGVMTAAFSGASAYAATLERDVAADSYTVSRADGKSGSYAVKMADAADVVAHLSYSAESTYRFQLAADVSGGTDYKLTVGTEGEKEPETVENITVYPTDDKLWVLGQLNDAADDKAVASLLKEKADVLELNRHPVYNTADEVLNAVSDDDLAVIAAAVYGGADYDTLADFYAAYYGSKGLILLNHAKNDEEAVLIGHLYQKYLSFNTLKGYALVKDNMESIWPRYRGQNQITAKAAGELFNSCAFLTALSQTQNEQQVLDLFENYVDLVTFDLTVWNNSVKSLTAKALTGQSCDTMEQLETAVKEAAESKTSGTSSSSNRGGGGGGGKNGLAATVAPEKVNGTEQTKKTYRDLSDSHWAYETVMYLTEKNVLNGDESGCFNPEAAVTRTEFAKMLSAGFGLYDETAACDFEDLPREHWAYHYVASLSEKGIVGGMDDRHFGGDVNISRQDMAVMITRISSVFSAETTETAFADGDAVADYAKAAVTSLSSLNIMNGYEDNTFSPQKSVTRAEAAAVLARSMKLYMGGTAE